jgi:hypothetical protein
MFSVHLLEHLSDGGIDTSPVAFNAFYPNAAGGGSSKASGPA